MMNAYNAALQEFVSNEAAVAVIGVGKEYIIAENSDVAPRGTKMITY